MMGVNEWGPVFAMAGKKLMHDTERWKQADAEELKKIGAAGIWIKEQEVPHDQLLYGCVTRREQKVQADGSPGILKTRICFNGAEHSWDQSTGEKDGGVAGHYPHTMNMDALRIRAISGIQGNGHGSSPVGHKVSVHISSESDTYVHEATKMVATVQAGGSTEADAVPVWAEGRIPRIRY